MAIAMAVSGMIVASMLFAMIVIMVVPGRFFVFVFVAVVMIVIMLCCFFMIMVVIVVRMIIMTVVVIMVVMCMFFLAVIMIMIVVIVRMIVVAGLFVAMVMPVIMIVRVKDAAFANVQQGKAIEVHQRDGRRLGRYGFEGAFQKGFQAGSDPEDQIGFLQSGRLRRSEAVAMRRGGSFDQKAGCTDVAHYRADERVDRLDRCDHVGRGESRRACERGSQKEGRSGKMYGAHGDSSGQSVGLNERCRVTLYCNTLPHRLAYGINHDKPFDRPDCMGPCGRRKAKPMLKPAEPLVRLEGAGVERDNRWLVRGVDLTVRAGEIVTLIGPNGSGKSTTAKIALGLMAPDAGTASRKPGLTVGYVPQHLSLDWTMPLTVDRFMRLTARPSKPEIDAALEATGCTHLRKVQLQVLSGGEFQRVMLARALARKPDLLVLDEPVQGVDFSGEIALYELIGKIRDEWHCGILLISHDLHVVMAATDRVICLNGHICCQGTPVAVAASDEYRRLFGPRAGGALAVYEHRHDHTHLPDGRVRHADGTITDHCHPGDGHHDHGSDADAGERDAR